MGCFNQFGKHIPLFGVVLFSVFLGGCQTSATNTTPAPVPEPVVVEPLPICPAPEISTPVAPTAPTAPLECPEIEPPSCPVCPAARIGTKIVLGEIEQITVKSAGMSRGVKYLARIDTGATSTSLHATNVTRFERDGERWVRFEIDNPRDQEIITLERPLVRRIRVKREEQDDRRLVVVLTLELGKITRHVEVSLTDRSEMEFPVLIGRNFLMDAAMVDVSQREIIK